jgi:hypothetical protein
MRSDGRSGFWKSTCGLVEASTTSGVCLPVESQPGRDRDLNTLLCNFFVHGGEINCKLFMKIGWCDPS